MTWKNEGTPPDYRFTLANERTFLAWIRTALAFMAAAVGLDQLTPELGAVIMKTGLVVTLSLTAATLACYAYCRWRRNEQAMWQNTGLPFPRGIIWLSAGLCAVIVTLLLMLTT